MKKKYINIITMDTSFFLSKTGILFITLTIETLFPIGGLGIG